MTPRRFALLAAATLVLVALVFARPASTPGPALRDFEAYYAAGITWHLGGDPYGRDVWRVERRIPGVRAGRDELLPFVGPPFTLPLWAAFGTLDFARAAFIWGLALVAAAAAFVFAILRIVGARDPASFGAGALLAIAFGPLTSAVALGQVALVACAGVALATLALGAAKSRLAIGAALLAAMQPNLGVALVARLSDRRAWFALAIAGGLVVAASIAVLGGAAPLLHYAVVLGAHAVAEQTVTIQTTVTAVAYGLGASRRTAAWLGLGLGIATLAVTAVALRDRRYSAAARVAVACAALPLVLPFAHEHDLAIALFPAIWCLRRARRILWPVAAAATVAIAVDWLGLAQRPSGLTQSVLLASAAALAATALSRGRLGAISVAPFAVVVATALVGAAVAHHPVAVWPDALGPVFRVPIALDAQTVWGLEQAAAGLAHPNAAAALLRLASLAGCGALWLVSLAVLRRRDDEEPPTSARYRLA